MINMMNLIREFKENYIAIDETGYQSVNSLKSNRNENIEDNIFNALCEKISNPIIDKVNLDLGSVDFVNDYMNILWIEKNINQIGVGELRAALNKQIA